MALLECVINVSEGRRLDVVAAVAAPARDAGVLLDTHGDAGHHRSVLTLGGPAEAVEAAAREVAAAAVADIDLHHHHGAHPRIGAVDVVPFVPLGRAPLTDALSARDRFARWAGEALALPCFLYGPERTLPDVRRGAFASLEPDAGPPAPHPTAGACAVGARPVLVAYNLWLATDDLALAKTVAAAVRSPTVRALGLDVGDGVQVSCNLLDPLTVGPAAVFDAVARRATVARAELVGLAPASVVEAVPRGRRAELGVGSSRTIESRLEEAGFDGGP